MTTSSLVKARAAALSMLIIGCSQNDQSQLTGPESSLFTAKSTNVTSTTGANNDRVRIQTRLFATTASLDVKGRARWENRPDRTKFNTELQHVATSGAHEVKVKGVSVAFVTINTGRGEVELDSRRGDTVPAMAIGDLVEVFNPAGELIASGNLQ